MSDNVMEYKETVFEDIKHVNENGQGFWYARELQKVLEYTEFNKFLPVIKKVMRACEQSGNDISDHFVQVSEMVRIGSGAVREFDSFELLRYECYLIVMNGDSQIFCQVLLPIRRRRGCREIGSPKQGMV